MEWISVKDRLPDGDNVKVLATDGLGVHMSIFYYDRWVKDYVFRYQGSKHRIQSTHWMPLPKPPKE